MNKKLLTMACALMTFAGAHAQTDVTDTYLKNAGFETSPVFDGTSLGASGTSATATSGSSLVNTNPNVYNIEGWTTMTTETSDFARTFTMPYNTTLYVNGNNNAGGQAVTPPPMALRCRQTTSICSLQRLTGCLTLCSA